MIRPTAVFLFIGLCLVFPMTTFSQGESAVPFLLVSSSPEGNGMGGTAATVPWPDALATISNPGQLGLFTLGNLFNASTYTPRTEWLPQFRLTGLNSIDGPSAWKLVSFRLARQAEDLLIVRKSVRSFDYQSGLGDLQYVNNVILGKVNPKATIRKGWQLQVAEVLYLRGGSYDGPGLAYSTSGYSICLAGLLKMLCRVSPSLGEDSWVGFAAEHFDLQYHSSKYEETHSPILGTTSAALNLVVRGFEP